MAAAGGKSVVACEKILARVDGLYDATKVVPVACLGRVDESLLVALAQKGATSITLVHNGCEECDLCPGLFTAEKVVETTNALLDTWNQPVRVTMVNKLPGFIRRAGEAEFDESRRAFFETIKDEAQAAAVITANEVIDDKLGTAKPEEPRYVKVQDDGTLPHFVPTRRERLLEELALMSEPKDELIETRLWGHVIIDIDTCSSCQMCATFCPTGAIRKFELPDGTFGVDHTPVDCVKCYCCTDICPTSALTLSSEVFATDIATKAISRYAMKPREFKTKDPHSMVNHMKKFTLCDQIYER
jgi:ferredoxin/coenzyme F420-reducing hydrogenase delta subunit